MYIRNLRKASPNKSVLKFTSIKTNQVIMCEGTIEFDACFHHEFNDDVIYFESQPQGFKYQFEGKELPYTPDALVVFKDEKTKYIEYKSIRQALKTEFKQKFKARKSASQELDIPLILVTDEQVRQEPLLTNLKLLHRYSSFTPQTELQTQILKILEQSKSIQLLVLVELFGKDIGSIRANIIQLIARNKIKADLNHDSLDGNPTVWGASHYE